MSLPRWRSRAIGLALGGLVAALTDHPSLRRPAETYERIVLAVEDRSYADDAAWGRVHTIALIGAAGVLGTVLERLTRRHPAPHAVATAAATVIATAGASGSGRSAPGLLAWGGLLGIGGLFAHRAARIVTDRIAGDDPRYAEFGRTARSLRPLLLAPGRPRVR